MSESEKRTKTRSRNFTETEKNLLLRIVRNDYLDCVENKQTDAVNVAKKKRTWDLITQEYNSQAETGPRTPKQLHALYDNLVRKNIRTKFKSQNMYRALTVDDIVIPKSEPLDSGLDYPIDVYENSLSSDVESSRTSTFHPFNGSTSIGHVSEGHQNKETAINIHHNSTENECKAELFPEDSLDDVHLSNQKNSNTDEVQVLLVTQQLKHDKMLFEINLQIKQNELEVKRIEIEHKKRCLT